MTALCFAYCSTTQSCLLPSFFPSSLHDDFHFYLVVKRRFRGRGFRFREAVSMLSMASLVRFCGVGYIQRFLKWCYAHRIFLQGPAALVILSLIIVFVVRSFPEQCSAFRHFDRLINQLRSPHTTWAPTAYLAAWRPSRCLISDSFLSGLVPFVRPSPQFLRSAIPLVTPRVSCSSPSGFSMSLLVRAHMVAYLRLCNNLDYTLYGSVLLMNWAIKHFGTSRALKEE